MLPPSISHSSQKKKTEEEMANTVEMASLDMAMMK